MHDRTERILIKVVPGIQSLNSIHLERQKNRWLPRSHLQTRKQIEQTLRGYPVNTKGQNIISYVDLTTTKTLKLEVCIVFKPVLMFVMWHKK